MMNKSRKQRQLKARIMGALGGRAAEDVVFGKGEITTGAGGDFQQVASMAPNGNKIWMSNLRPYCSRRWQSRSFCWERFND